VSESLWICTTCGTEGIDDGPPTKTDPPRPGAKHLETCAGATVQTMRPGLVARLREAAIPSFIHSDAPQPVESALPNGHPARDNREQETTSASRPRTKGVRAPVQGLADRMETTDS
jgi:hypothetical protein